MLTVISLLLIVATLVAFLSSAQSGIFMVLLSAPVIAMTWDTPLIGVISPPRIFGVMVPLAVGLRIMMSGRQFSGVPLLGVWAAYSWYALVPAAVITIAKGPVAGIEVAFRTLNGLVGFMMLQTWCNDRESFRRLLLVVMAAGLIPMGMILYQIATGVIWRVHMTVGLMRLVGFYHDSQTVRMFAFQTMTALILYWACFKPRMIRQLLLLGYGVVCAVVLFKSYSKAGSVIAVAWVLIWAVGRRQILPAVLVIGAVLAFNVVYYDQIWSETEQLFSKELAAVDEDATGDVSDYTEDRTLGGRWVGWKMLVNRYAERSVLLQVFGGGSVMAAHNDFLGALMEGGIVGLGLYVALLIGIGTRVVRNYRRDRSPLNVMAVMLLAMWLVDAIGLIPRGYPSYQWYVWGFIGLALRGVDLRTVAERVAAERAAAERAARGAGPPPAGGGSVPAGSARRPYRPVMPQAAPR